jgi:cytochrome oxidase Cu insertion factor (SCO1/SenC/PrrC family)
MSNRLLLAATLSIVALCFCEGVATAQPRPPENDVSSASAKYFPNLVMRSQDDVPVHFYEDLLKGKVVLINFIFTTCQGVCSPMTANLARVQSYLAEQMDKEVVMISISVDPETDTPDVLKKYAAKFKARPGWYFLTGEKRNVDWVLYKLGGYVEEKQQHTSLLIIGNEATGEWMKVNAMGAPSEIASLVTKLLK